MIKPPISKTDIKNRYMGYNIRLIEDVIDHFDKLQMNGVMFFADFQKAFDSLDWYFMFSTLDFFNFGPSFKHWIRTLYASPVGKVKNNGYVVKPSLILDHTNHKCE